jgi:uncharacterized protein YciI
MALYAMTLLVTGSPDEVEPVAGEYREQLRVLRGAGRVRAAGEFAGGDGFLVILDVADRMEAEQTARSNPLVELGLATYMLREWLEI